MGEVTSKTNHEKPFKKLFLSIFASCWKIWGLKVE